MGGVTVLVSLGVMEREAAFFITAAIAIGIALQPIREGLTLFIITIPFFLALPFFEHIDSMANWRFLLAILFLRYLVEQLRATRLTILIAQLFRSRLFWATAVFLGWGLVSAAFAPYPIIGVKKIIFLGQIFLLFPIVRFTAFHDAETGKFKYPDIRNAALWSLGSVSIIGFSQFAGLFLVTLEQFWRFWAGKVIPVLYGYGLGELLQTSNTWFSYSGDGPPTLRMFSVFPDSHSFAMYVMLGVSIPAALWIERGMEHPNQGWLRAMRNKWFWIALALLFAIVLSGSRGVWASAVVLALLLCVLRVYTGRLQGLSEQSKGVLRTVTQKLITLLICFAVLFVPASYLLALTQWAQGAKADAFTSLKRAKSITDLDEISNRSRLQIWQAAGRTILANPVLGIGTGNFSVALGEDIDAAKKGASAHNLYLDIASEMGMVGLAGFVAIIALLMWSLGAQALSPAMPASSKILAGTFLVCLVWILGYSFFDVVLFNDKVLMFAALMAGMTYRQA